MRRFALVGLVVVGCGSEEPGLPEGESVWTGELEAAGFALDAELTVTNTGGDLAGTVEFANDTIGEGSYGVTGTYEPTSHRIALAPEDWIDTPGLFTPELLGFSGTYDPETLVVSGTSADYASGEDNGLEGGPASFTVAGDGSPLQPGDGALGLPAATRTFTGTMQCTGLEREVEGELTYDGAGDVSGTLTFGDPTLAAASATFAFTGVHNPTTGGITLVPGLYTDTDPSFIAFFVEAAYDPSADSATGELRQNVGACPPNRWQIAF